MNTTIPPLDKQPHAADSSDTAGRRMIVAGAIFLVTYLVARFTVARPEVAGWLRTALCVAPPLAGVLFIVSALRVVRSLDELQRRIQLEALAFAFPAGFLISLVLSLLQLSGLLRPDPWDYWLFQLPMYVAGLAMANRRYRFN